MSDIYLVSGDDSSLLSQKVRELVAACIDGMDADLALSRLESADYKSGDGYELSAVVSAASTPPMMEEFRIIEARDLGMFSTEKDLSGLYEYLKDPMESTKLILVWEKGLDQTRLSPLPKKLKESVLSAGGEVISASKPRGAKNSKEWFASQIKNSGLLFSGQALALLKNRLGEDFGRLKSLLESLKSAYGTEDAEMLSPEDIQPYLGEAGSLPVWELTAALSKGNTEQSLSCLMRRLDAGEHPVAVIAFLVNHYFRLARLDQAGYSSPDDVAGELGISSYPARLALEESQKLGSKKIARIFELLQEADMDLKGRSGLDGRLIMEVLIARIAQQYRL